MSKKLWLPLGAITLLGTTIALGHTYNNEKQMREEVGEDIKKDKPTQVNILTVDNALTNADFNWDQKPYMPIDVQIELKGATLALVNSEIGINSIEINVLHGINPVYIDYKDQCIDGELENEGTVVCNIKGLNISTVYGEFETMTDLALHAKSLKSSDGASMYIGQKDNVLAGTIVFELSHVTIDDKLGGILNIEAADDINKKLISWTVAHEGINVSSWTQA